ncbi:MAG: penicillin-binding protein, partial [Bacteroidota bacterium]
GITPYLVSGVWVGAQDRRVHFSSIKYGQGANMALPVWAEYMQGVYGDEEINLPDDPFTMPAGFNEDLSCRSKTTEETKPDEGAKPDEFDGDGF